MATIVQVREEIDVTEQEKQLFDFLLRVVSHACVDVEIRVAGGWVRDKLIGKECNDIDIAVDSKTGEEFCKIINDYLSSIGEERKEPANIPSNPEKSKHLETSKICLFNFDIDVVKLRLERYSESSRVPTEVPCATPEEDAYRRDLTINSLFYNIKSRSVEDFTRKGIEHLRTGTIATPQHPKKTFLDDPLRVLRAIRFGAKLGYVLDEELKQAASDAEVKAAIADKISRERIGHEVDLMMTSHGDDDQPVKAMTYIFDLQLFWVVFTLPPSIDSSLYDGWDKHCVTYVRAASELIREIGVSTFTDNQRRLALYSALFLPFRKITYGRNKKGNRKFAVVNYIICDSLKLKCRDAEMVVGLHDATEKLLPLIPLTLSSVDSQTADVDLELRVLLGLLLKEIKEFWRVMLLMSTLLYTSNIYDVTDSCDDHLKLFEKIGNVIKRLDLEKIWEVKPLVHGQDIMRVLQLKKDGPLVGEWKRKSIEWQLAHPLGTADEFINWMRQHLITDTSSENATQLVHEAYPVNSKRARGVYLKDCSSKGVLCDPNSNSNCDGQI